MRRRFAPKRKSLRENLLESRRGLEHYAALAGRPIPAEIQRISIPEKRAYTKRSDGSEHDEQSTVVQWWNNACGTYGLPPFALFAVPNGAHLASGYIGAGRLKREGMRSGMLDLVLAAPRDQFHGFFLEMKYGKNRPSDEQIKVKDYLQGAGYMTGVYWSADSAIAAIKDYLA